MVRILKLILKIYYLLKILKLYLFKFSSANATPAFEGRGGEDLANEISSALLKAYDVLPLNNLCIVPGFSCWKLYVDILILECGGNYIIPH